MTKEEICKVLECCSSPEYRCNECPIDQKKKDDCECGTFGMGEALTLIKELTEENKKTHDQYEHIRLDRQKAFRRKREVARILHGTYTMLHASCTELTQCCTKLETLHKIECKRVDTIKAATVREMQKIISANYAVSKVHYAENEAPTITYQLTNWQLDQIAKEMIGETK